MGKIKQDREIELTIPQIQQLARDAVILAAFAKIHATDLHSKVQVAASRTWKLLQVGESS